ncbi:MAG: hypothetical protein GYB42_11935 [Alphaproteobacteria bacterium]|nr:hypothetical protein [Alphaproteobacteria bacterium]
MIKFLATLRNILVIIVLSWLGFNEAPKDNNAPEDNRVTPSSQLLFQ